MKLLAWLACLPLIAGCASFRAAMMDLNNTGWVGEVAPPLGAGQWIGDEPRVDGDWYLVAFLKPM